MEKSNIWKSVPEKDAIEIDLTKVQIIGQVHFRDVYQIHGAYFPHSVKVKKQARHIIPAIVFAGASQR